MLFVYPLNKSEMVYYKVQGKDSILKSYFC